MHRAWLVHSRCTVAPLNGVVGLEGAVRGRAWMTSIKSDERGNRPADFVGRALAESGIGLFRAEKIRPTARGDASKYSRRLMRSCGAPQPACSNRSAACASPIRSGVLPWLGPNQLAASREFPGRFTTVPCPLPSQHPFKHAPNSSADSLPNAATVAHHSTCRCCVA